MPRRLAFTALPLILAAAGLVGFVVYVKKWDPAWWATAWPVAVPVLAGDLLLGGFYWRQSNKLEDERAARADKRSFQHTLYVANLTGVDMQDADLTDLNFGGRDLSGANLSRANLSEVRMLSANLSRAKLFSANLSGAKMLGANLTEANLTDTDLAGANLFGANLTGAHMLLANLSGSALDRARLTRAVMTMANLTNASLSGVKWDPEDPPEWPESFDPPENAWDPDKDF